MRKRDCCYKSMLISSFDGRNLEFSASRSLADDIGGAFPAQLGEPLAMEGLFLSRNRFSGSIPYRVGWGSNVYPVVNSLIFLPIPWMELFQNLEHPSIQLCGQSGTMCGHLIPGITEGRMTKKKSLKAYCSMSS